MHKSSIRRSERSKKNHQPFCHFCLTPMKVLRNTKKYCSQNCRQQAYRYPDKIKLCSLKPVERNKDKLESETERFYITRWGTKSKMDVANIGRATLETSSRMSYQKLKREWCRKNPGKEFNKPVEKPRIYMNGVQVF